MGFYNCFMQREMRKENCEFAVRVGFLFIVLLFLGGESHSPSFPLLGKVIFVCAAVFRRVSSFIYIDFS